MIAKEWKIFDRLSELLNAHDQDLIATSRVSLLEQALQANDELVIVQALSGG